LCAAKVSKRRHNKKIEKGTKKTDREKSRNQVEGGYPGKTGKGFSGNEFPRGMECRWHENQKSDPSFFKSADESVWGGVGVGDPRPKRDGNTKHSKPMALENQEMTLGGRQSMKTAKMAEVN